MNGGLRLVKMSGAGNDFLIPELEELPRWTDPAAWVRQVCRRGVSVGADGVLFVEPAGQDRVRVRFHNPDGSVAFCGNGSRCAARFARLRGLAGESMILETEIGEVRADVIGDRVRLILPPPCDRGPLTIDVAGERLSGRFVDAGAPHFVVFVPSLEQAPLQRWGPGVRRHARFGATGTNFDVVVSRGGPSVALRTWERGVEGETLSCGTGAIAAAFAARLDGAPRRINVVPASGIPLDVTLSGRSAELAGDARLVFEARLTAEAIPDVDARRSGQRSE